MNIFKKGFMKSYQHFGKIYTELTLFAKTEHEYSYVEIFKQDCSIHIFSMPIFTLTMKNSNKEKKSCYAACTTTKL